MNSVPSERILENKVHFTFFSFWCYFVNIIINVHQGTVNKLMNIIAGLVVCHACLALVKNRALGLHQLC